MSEELELVKMEWVDALEALADRDQTILKIKEQNRDLDIALQKERSSLDALSKKHAAVSTEVAEVKVARDALGTQHCAVSAELVEVKVARGALAVEQRGCVAKFEAVSVELAVTKAALAAMSADHEQCVGTLEVRDAKITEIEEQR